MKNSLFALLCLAVIGFAASTQACWHNSCNGDSYAEESDSCSWGDCDEE